MEPNLTFHKLCENQDLTELISNFFINDTRAFCAVACTSVTSWSKFAIKYTLVPEGPMSQHIHLIEEQH